MSTQTGGLNPEADAQFARRMRGFFLIPGAINLFIALGLLIGLVFDWWGWGDYWEAGSPTAGFGAIDWDSYYYRSSLSSVLLDVAFRLVLIAISILAIQKVTSTVRLFQFIGTFLGVQVLYSLVRVTTIFVKWSFFELPWFWRDFRTFMGEPTGRWGFGFDGILRSLGLSDYVFGWFNPIHRGIQLLETLRFLTFIGMIGLLVYVLISKNSAGKPPRMKQVMPQYQVPPTGNYNATTPQMPQTQQGSFQAGAPSTANFGLDQQMAQLERLASLHREGILTKEEFEKKKREILGN